MLLSVLVAPGAAAHLVHCSGEGQQCNESFTDSLSVDQPATFSLTVGAPEGQCSAVSYTLLFQGRVVGKTDFLVGGASQRFELGLLKPGDYSYEIKAEGKKGRCNTGALESWGVDHTLDWTMVSDD